MGLASLFLLLNKIAASPLKTLERYSFDLETLVLLWRETMLRHGVIQRNAKTKRQYAASECGFFGKEEKDTAEILLNAATKRCLPRVLYMYGLDLLKSECPEKGKVLLETLVSSSKASIDLCVKALRNLAIDAEWRLQNIKLALFYTEKALSLLETACTLKDELEHRRERLIKKLCMRNYEHEEHC
jgi:hypothetical protein